jgi:flavodoxin
LARQIHEAVGGDLVEIQTVQPYPDDYDALVAQNAEEQRTNYMPPLRTTIENIQDYDVIFIGSPIWNVRLTPPVRSFLSSHDLSGKIIAPFVTYKVSGLGRSRREYRRITPRKHHFGRPLRYLVEPARQSPRCRAGLRALDFNSRLLKKSFVRLFRTASSPRW